MHLTRDAVLAAKDSEAVEVPVPEWAAGGTVLVRGMTGKERDQFEVSLAEEGLQSVQVQRGRGGGGAPRRNLVNIRARVVARCCVDDDGNRLFTDADVTALGDKAGAPVDRIFEVASRLSGMGPEDMEAMAANFGKAEASGAGSSSPSPRASAGRSKGS